MIYALRFSETSVNFYRTARRHMQENRYHCSYYGQISQIEVRVLIENKETQVI
jgi:hypothetical protein